MATTPTSSGSKPHSKHLRLGSKTYQVSTSKTTQRITTNQENPNQKQGRTMQLPIHFKTADSSRQIFQAIDLFMTLSAVKLQHLFPNDTL